MAKAKSVAEQIEDLQAENIQLKEQSKKVEKLFNLMCEIEFGMSKKEVDSKLKMASNSIVSEARDKNDRSGIPTAAKPVELGE